MCASITERLDRGAKEGFRLDRQASANDVKLCLVSLPPPECTHRTISADSSELDSCNCSLLVGEVDGWGGGG